MNLKDSTITILNRSMSNYVASREFAQYKIYRLEQQDGLFQNPNLHRELIEFQSQVERCDHEISNIILCIEWINSLKKIAASAA